MPFIIRLISHAFSDIFIHKIRVFIFLETRVCFNFKDIQKVRYKGTVFKIIPPVRLDAKEHPTHLPIHKNRAGALLCLLTHPFFAHLGSGLLIQTDACIAINCIQAVCRIATAQVEIIFIKTPGNNIFLSKYMFKFF